MSGNYAPTQVYAMPYGAYGGARHGYGYPSYGHAGYAPAYSHGPAYYYGGRNAVAYVSAVEPDHDAPATASKHIPTPVAANTHGRYGYATYNYGYPAYNYGSYGHGGDGKVVQVINRSDGYGNVGYGQPTPFLTNKKV